jgi:hypothetical protein
MFKALLGLTITMVSLLASVALAEDLNTIHKWYAGTTHYGVVETSGFAWQCSGGTCVLQGP